MLDRAIVVVLTLTFWRMQTSCLFRRMAIYPYQGMRFQPRSGGTRTIATTIPTRGIRICCSTPPTHPPAATFSNSHDFSFYPGIPRCIGALD